MDAIIQKIIDIEQRAQQIVNEAEDEKRKLEKNLTFEILQMGDEVRKKADTKIEQVRKIEMEEANQAVNDVLSKSEQQIQSLISYSNRKRAQWEELLIQRIIGR